MPQGLHKFLLAWPTVQIKRHPDTPEKIGAVPLGVELPVDLRELFHEKPAPPGSLKVPSENTGEVVSAAQDHSLKKIQSTHRSYLPDFWRAFHIPIEDRRFVILPESNGRIQIVDRSLGPDERGFEITQSDVTSAPGALMSERVQATAKRIEAWLDRNSLAVEPFLSVATRSPYGWTRREPKFAAEVQDDYSVVARALAKLDSSDLARVNIPFDLVVKMLASVRG
jgi:hypothetical protein